MRSKVLQTVHSPLGFFVLALLIVEVFLFGSGMWFGLPDYWKLVAIGVGVLLFLVVFLAVFWLVVRHPQNLVFSEESHVQFAAMIYGHEAQAISRQDLEALPPQQTPNPPVGQLHDATKDS
jgi:high-affinity Fe2+/Pb2+ permease